MERTLFEQMGGMYSQVGDMFYRLVKGMAEKQGITEQLNLFMKTPKYYFCLTNEEFRLTLQALVELINRFIREGKYTDAADELIIKFSKAKIKRIRTT